MSTITVAMVTKLCKWVTYLDMLLPVKLPELSITWSCEVTWKTKTTNLHYQSAYDHQTWQNDNHLAWWAPAYKSHHLWWRGLVRSCDKLKWLYLYYHSPMTTNFCRMVNYLYGLLPMKSHGSLITWSCKIIWQTKIIISPLPQCLWPPTSAGW